LKSVESDNNFGDQVFLGFEKSSSKDDLVEFFESRRHMTLQKREKRATLYFFGVKF